MEFRPPHAVAQASTTPRRPLGLLTNTPAKSVGKLLAGSRTPQCFSRPPHLSPNLAALCSRPRAPSTPGGLSDLTPGSTASGLDISDDTDAPLDFLGVAGAIGNCANAGRSALYIPEADRYSVGGTAFGGYEGFSAPAARTKKPAVRDSITSLVPASTRALMLEERLRELEVKNRALEDANSQLRQRQHAATLAPPAPLMVESATQATTERHPMFGRLVADLGHKKSTHAFLWTPA